MQPDLRFGCTYDQPSISGPDSAVRCLARGTLLTGGVGSIGPTCAGMLPIGFIFNMRNFKNGVGWI